MGVGVLALYFRASGQELAPGLAALTFGVAIISAAFLLSWAVEVAKLDIAQALALAIVALVAVLPEYVVDLYFAWQAGAHPGSEYASYAAANMTGANRLLVGIGWPLVGLLWWFKSRHGLWLRPTASLEITFLAFAALYAVFIPFRGQIGWWDALVLIGWFAAYMWLSSRAEAEEPELLGPAAAIGALVRGLRRAVTLGLLLYAAGVIVTSAEPFAEGLIQSGKGLGIDEFVLVQWLAPLASESPEILLAAILTLRGNGLAGMTILISAMVNQWTLLIGSLPVVYSISLGSLSGLPLDARQVEEVFLTAAQAIFAVTLLLRLRISWLSAITLL
ncbi:MAG: sodium:calcium antiporter, partial [Dehalococcoidia bacterium]